MDSSAKMLSFPKPGIELYSFTKLKRPFPPHFHKRWLIGCLTSGNRILRAGGRQKMLIVPGDLVILPPFASHSCSAAGSSGCDWLCAQIDPCLFGKPDSGATAGVLAGRHDLCGQFSQLVMNAFASKKTGTLAWNSFLANITASIRKPGATGNSQVAITTFAEICTRLASLPAEKISLDDMASAARQGKFVFLRGFRASIGITPCKYLANLRLLEAQRLLQGGCRLAECAIACGFYDQSHFCRLFKASIGVTPGAYRESCSPAGGHEKC